MPVPARKTTLLKVSLRLTEAESASLHPRAEDAPPLVRAILARWGSPEWATEEELAAAVAWLRAAASELNDPAIANSFAEQRHEVSASWRWPDHPLVEVALDRAAIAAVDYFPASASAHWYLHWTGDPNAARGPSDLPLLPLATMVPEEAEADSDIRAAVLDAAIEAAANELTGRRIRIELSET